ncbi:H-2 class I histocompatibility antigen, Q9 alpha chain-like [Astyanax mexicanus]|uniref:H-2 class I histocompatibility antigen, Q9 alpha chain-like n=1 Tax=Astyanax mexicanus TaxID=7994 RepID=UPI0020CB51D4|nr:H-2 class I histocompatibility antigen, Q9 alpha chain-like [Astyanax mexicanus]
MVVLKILLFLTAAVPLSSAETHSLRYVYTAVTPGINLPEFTNVGQVDGEPFVYYDSDSRNFVPKTEWIKKIVGYEAGYFDRETQNHHGYQETFKVSVQNVMQRFNQTKGVHTWQNMYGCEMDDDGTKRGYDQFGYDGEDFVSLDLNTLTWTAPTPQAVITKQKWEKSAWAVQDKAYLMTQCIEWLQKYVGYGRSTLMRKVSPEVDLFSSDSSSPVVCHATGFFPKAVMISWQKNGEELNEDVELRETLTNQDGTFQKRSILTLSPEELKNNKYTCVVQHSSLEKELVLKVSDRRVLSGGVPLGVIAGVVVAALIVLIACVGFVIWKKKKSDEKPVFTLVSGNPKAPSETSSDTS